MKTHCDLIQDLMPLYIDGICSEESKKVIEEHVQQCSHCQEQLSSMTATITLADDNKRQLDDAKVIQSIARSWSKTKWYAWVRGVIVATACFTLLIISYKVLTEWKIVTVPAKIIEVSEVFQLADGSISFRLKANDGYEMTNLHQTYDKEGNSYLIGYRTLIKKKINDTYVNYGFHNRLHRMNPKQENELLLKLNNEAGVSAWYYGTEDDRILIWKEGIETPFANDELEQYWKSEGDLIYPDIKSAEELR